MIGLKYKRWYVGELEPTAAVDEYGYVVQRFNNERECDIAVHYHNEPLDFIAELEKRVRFYQNQLESLSHETLDIYRLLPKVITYEPILDDDETN